MDMPEFRKIIKQVITNLITCSWNDNFFSCSEKLISKKIPLQKNKVLMKRTYFYAQIGIEWETIGELIKTRDFIYKLKKDLEKALGYSLSNLTVSYDGNTIVIEGE